MKLNREYLIEVLKSNHTKTGKSAVEFLGLEKQGYLEEADNAEELGDYSRVADLFMQYLSPKLLARLVIE